MDKKLCSKCEETLEISNFPKRKSNGKPYSYCKKCYAKRTREYYQKNKEKVLRYQKEYAAKNKEKLKESSAAYREKNKDRLRASKCSYAKTDAGRENAKEASRRFEVKNPLKKKAHRKVNNAIRDGRLIRPDKCEVCDTLCKPHAHHWSYEEENWLDVQWVCLHCHIEIHHFKPLRRLPV